MMRNCLTFVCALLFVNSITFSHLSFTVTSELTTWSLGHQSAIKGKVQLMVNND